MILEPSMRYDSLFQFYWQEVGVRFEFAADLSADWRLAKCQAIVESNLDPAARSPAGALGLLQLMPAVDLAADGKRDADNPEESIKEGLAHLGYLWKMFAAERGLERWWFALGAYNGGPGYVIAAQALAENDGLPTDQWSSIAVMLPRVRYKEKAPDHAQIVGYVRKIRAAYLALRAGT